MGEEDSNEGIREENDVASDVDEIEESEEEVEGEEFEEEEEEEEEDYFQIDTNDQVKVKQVLDEAIAAVVSMNETSKYEVDYRQENYKMLAMAVACAFALGAQFAPWEFPDSRPFLGFCAVGYFIVSIYVQYLITVVDGDSILLLKPTPNAPTGIRIRTQFPKAQQYFTILISDNDKSVNNGEGNTTFLTFSVGNFFDVKGNFFEHGIVAEVNNLCQKFDKKKFNSPQELEELFEMINGTTKKPESKLLDQNNKNEKNEKQKITTSAASNSKKKK